MQLKKPPFLGQTDLKTVLRARNLPTSRVLLVPWLLCLGALILIVSTRTARSNSTDSREIKKDSESVTTRISSVSDFLIQSALLDYWQNASKVSAESLDSPTNPALDAQLSLQSLDSLFEGFMVRHTPETVNQTRSIIVYIDQTVRDRLSPISGAYPEAVSLSKFLKAIEGDIEKRHAD